MIHPVLFGERHDKSLKASVSGLDYASLSNVGLLFHSLSEGVVNHLHCMVSPEYLASQGIARLQVSGSVPTNNVVVIDRLRLLYSGRAHASENKDHVFHDVGSPQGTGGIGCDNETGDVEGVKPRVEVVMDTRGLESVGSALGAARVAHSYSSSR